MLCTVCKTFIVTKLPETKKNNIKLMRNNVINILTFYFILYPTITKSI